MTKTLAVNKPSAIHTQPMLIMERNQLDMVRMNILDKYQENGDEEEEALAVKKHLHLRRMCYRGAVSQWGQNDR